MVNKQRFLQQDWKLYLKGDIENNIEDLEDEVAELQCEAAHASQDIRDSDGDSLTTGETARTLEIETLKKDNKQLQSRARELSTELHDGSSVTTGRAISQRVNIWNPITES